MKSKKLFPFGLQISEVSKEDLMNTSISSLEESLQSEGLVVIDDIKMEPEDLQAFCERFSILEETDPIKSENGLHGVLRVTNEKAKDGSPKGIFGHDSPLDWHANRPSSLDRKSIVCTYSSAGCDSTQTWWANTKLAFLTLDGALKSNLRNTKAYFGYKENSYTEEAYRPHMNRNPWPIVFERYGEEVFYFPFNQIIKMKLGNSDLEHQLVEDLKNYVIQEDFVYKHEWRGNQIILSDQWTTIHCRPKCRMEGRKILRLTFNYSDDQFPFSENE